ncbi:MAG: zinc dependent phospholipase C family protein [Firmicutes bacterium]|nr:zinc dependent phospholipase C family protein [Bacillota bacterium]
MPGFLTHYIAGQAVLNSAEPDIQKIIAKDERLYNLGTQGPDIFFYYFPGIIRKRSRDIGGQMHKNDLGLFIARMAHLAKKAAGDERDLIFAYTAGIVMHYMIDVHSHPYVYAKVYNENATGIKNSADHRAFETAIDIALLKLVSGKKPADYSQWELIRAEAEHLIVAAKAMSRVIKLVYDRTIPPQDVYRAMRHMIQLTRLLRSRKGRRKKWTALVENLTVGEPLFSSMVHEQEVDEATDYLNHQRTPWKAPWEDEDAEHCTDSFFDRYNAAVDEGLEIIQSLYDYVYGDLPLKTLGDKLGNRSLQTGAPCSQNLW